MHNSKRFISFHKMKNYKGDCNFKRKNRNTNDPMIVANQPLIGA